MQPLRIYIAAPYTPKDCSLLESVKQVQFNIDRVIEAGNYIHGIGHYAHCPHLNHYMYIHHTNTQEKTQDGTWFYEYDNTYIDHWATAFLYLAPSYGADMELARAMQKKLWIFDRLKDIPTLEKG